MVRLARGLPGEVERQQRRRIALQRQRRIAHRDVARDLRQRVEAAEIEARHHRHPVLLRRRPAAERDHHVAARRDHLPARREQPRRGVGERLEHTLGEQIVRHDLRDDHVGAAFKIGFNVELGRIARHHAHALGKPVRRDDLARHVGDRGIFLARDDAPGAGARCHHREQAAPCADVEHMRARCDRAADRGVERGVARFVAQHVEMPARDALADQLLGACSDLDIVGLVRARLHRERVDAPTQADLRSEPGKPCELAPVLAGGNDHRLESGARCGF